MLLSLNVKSFRLGVTLLVIVNIGHLLFHNSYNPNTFLKLWIFSKPRFIILFSNCFGMQQKYYIHELQFNHECLESGLFF